MKKVFIAYAALVLLVIFLAVIKFRDSSFFPTFSPATATIASQKFNLEIADDEKERQKGLSKRASLGNDKGMLFVFEKKDKYSFWMKDTKIPLDIIFISDSTIVDMYKNVPPQDGKENANLPIYTSKAPANYVLEINGGLSDKYGIKIGDKITINR